jgi:hypothetical protein
MLSLRHSKMKNLTSGFLGFVAFCRPRLHLVIGIADRTFGSVCADAERGEGVSASEVRSESTRCRALPRLERGAAAKGTRSGAIRLAPSRGGTARGEGAPLPSPHKA